MSASAVNRAREYNTHPAVPRVVCVRVCGAGAGRVAGAGAAGGHDLLFEEQVRCDLRAFLRAAPRRVLLFPPVNNRRRFLIHRCAEEHPVLTSLSIGVGCERRTVVCFREALLSDVACAKPAMGLSQNERQSRPASCQGVATAGGEGGGVYRPPALAHRLNSQQTQEKIRSGPTKKRRPDRAVYVPRARRSAENSQTCPNDSESRISHNSEADINNKCTDLQPPLKIEKNQPTSPRKSLDRRYCNVYTPPHLRKVESNVDPWHDSIDAVPLSITQVPNNDSAISYSDNSFNDKVFSDNSNISHNDNGQNSVEYASNECCSDNETETDVFYINYNENNSNFYVDNFDYNQLQDKLNGINMAVPNPDQNVVIQNDTHLYNNKDEDIEKDELKRASQEINRSNRRIIRQSFDSDILVISDPVIETKNEEKIQAIVPEHCIVTEPHSIVPEEAAKPKLEPKVSLKREDNDWDTVFDDDGECLDPSLLEELTATVGKVQITKPKNNYEPYIERGLDLTGDTFGHVVEVYNFPTEFKTNDLLSVFSDYKDTGFEIKWVDDNHALIVFSSAKIAADVMATQHPMVRCRPLRDATAESRNKAKKCSEFLQPYRQRPETCTALARRLVTGALGLKLSTARQERAEERRLIGIAREKKRQAALHKEAAWDGSLTSQQLHTS